MKDFGVKIYVFKKSYKFIVVGGGGGDVVVVLVLAIYNI
jgi:hypothetical protein